MNIPEMPLAIFEEMVKAERDAPTITAGRLAYLPLKKPARSENAKPDAPVAATLK